MAAKVDIWNEGVSEIRATQIASPDERSLEAEQCAIHYPRIVEEMLEGSFGHDWGFANKRLPLAQLATNDRSGEWGYAYQLPTDCATPIRVLPDLSALGLGIPVGWYDDPYFETWAVPEDLASGFLIEGATLYTSGSPAFLEYGINTIEEGRLPALCRRAIAVELACRIAFPVKGDKELKQALQVEAQLCWERAIADDQNRNPQRTPDFQSETLRARRGQYARAC